MNKGKVWVVMESVAEESPSIVGIFYSKAHAMESFKGVLNNYIDPDTTDKEEKDAYEKAVNDCLYSDSSAEVSVAEHDINDVVDEETAKVIEEHQPVFHRFRFTYNNDTIERAIMSVPEFAQAFERFANDGESEVDSNGNSVLTIDLDIEDANSRTLISMMEVLGISSERLGKYGWERGLKA